MRAIALLLFLLAFLPAKGIEQHATICKFQVQPSKAITGAAVYDITGTICFEHSMDDFKKSGDSIEKTYALAIRFKEGSKTITANLGFGKFYSDEKNFLAFNKNQRLSMSDVTSYSFSISVPASAFNLPAGQHTLTPVVEIVGAENERSILRKSKIAPVDIYLLPTEKIKLWVKHILVDSLDADGQLWDYSVLNPIESNPDIVWSLKYAGLTYFSSKIKRNVFEYNDDKQLETFELTISKGDTLNIEVKDVDDLTPDDIVGNIIVATLNQKGKIITAKSGQIKLMQYVIEHLN